MFSRAPLVAQVFVYGDSLKAQLVAVVVPDPDVLLPWASERGMAKDLPTLCGDAAVAAAVLRSMQSEGHAAQLKGFEQVRSRPCCRLYFFRMHEKSMLRLWEVSPSPSPSGSRYTIPETFFIHSSALYTVAKPVAMCPHKCAVHMKQVR